MTAEYSRRLEKVEPDRVYWRDLVEPPNDWPRGHALFLKDGIVSFIEYHYDSEENYRSFSRVDFTADEFDSAIKEIQELQAQRDQEDQQAQKRTSVTVYGKDADKEQPTSMVDHMRIELSDQQNIRMIFHEHRSQYQLRRNSVSVVVETNLGKLI